MSSWYVLSAMGFYRCHSRFRLYVIGSTVISKVTLGKRKGTLPSSQKMSHLQFLIQSATLNGKPYGKSFIHHSDIMNGGELIFTMGNKPNNSGVMLPEIFLNQELMIT